MFTTLTAAVADRVTRIRVRRAEAADRDRLRAELASYTTPAERAELGALIGRQSEEDAAQLAKLLG